MSDPEMSQELEFPEKECKILMINMVKNIVKWLIEENH
jgi:hypothetical protein